MEVREATISDAPEVLAFVRAKAQFDRERLIPAQLRPVRDWMAHYERFWDEHLERLEKHLTKRDE
jgi:hypothetical protein